MPNANAKVAIEIYVDDKGSLRIREFAAKTGGALDDIDKKNRGITGRIKAGWASVAVAFGAVMAAIMALREAWNLMNTAAKAQQERVAFENLARSYGASGKQMLAELKRVSNGTVAEFQLIRNAGTAMMMGIDPKNVTGLMKIAAATAKMTGQTVTKAFEDITLASARESKMILDNLGIIVDLEKAYDKYAQKLGTTASALSDNQKKVAFMNAVFEEGGDLINRLGGQTDTAADKLQRLEATFENIKVAVGGGLLRVFFALKGTIEWLAAGATEFFGGLIFGTMAVLGSITDSLHITTGAWDKWSERVEAATAASKKLTGDAAQSFKDAISSNEEMFNGQNKYNAALKKTGDLLKEQAKAKEKLVEQQKALLDKEKKAANDRQSVVEEMYKEAGFGAEAYFQAESNKLVKKAADWEKAGADTLQVEEWLYEQLGKLSQEAWSKGETSAGQYMDSLQTQSRTLVGEFNDLQVTISEQLDQVGLKAEALDGFNLELSASFDGTPVLYGLESLISKFHELQQASAAARSGSSSSSGSDAGTTDSDQETDPFNESTDEFIDRVDNQSNTTINNNYNFNNQMSRSDVNNVIDEQRRRESRS